MYSVYDLTLSRVISQESLGLCPNVWGWALTPPTPSLEALWEACPFPPSLQGVPRYSLGLASLFWACCFHLWEAPGLS